MSNLATRDEATIDRERWSWRFDSLATNIGFVAFFANLWRFPFLLYSNGGAIFLVPYLLCTIFLAIPLLFLEMAIGQYTSLGSIKAWKICPLFQGIGVASTIVIGWRNIYYNVILAWTLYYLYSSFLGGELPWASCDREWNTPSCFRYEPEWVCLNGTYVNRLDLPQESESESSLPWPWWISYEESSSSDSCSGEYPERTIPAREFWKNKVLRQSESSGIHDLGAIVGHLALTLFLTWTLIYFLLWQGVKWSGKVAYFTTVFIPIVLFILLLRGVTLPGMYEGLLFYLYPARYLLTKTRVWLSAGTEAFYSFSVGLGVFTALGSHNKFHYSVFRDSMIVSFFNLITSIYGGIIVFSFIGFVAYIEGVPINDVVGYPSDVGGIGLLFEVFPRAFIAMPGSTRIWAIFFFLTVLMILLNSQLVTVRAFITNVLDIFPKRLRKGYYREFFVLGVCFVNFLIGLSMVTEGGFYVFNLLEVYSSSPFALAWICFFESVAIAWFYGVERFSSDIASMLNWHHYEFYVCWLVTVPLLSLLVWIGNIFYWSPLSSVGSDEYPLWADVLGYFITASSMVCIPAGMIYAVVYQLFKGDGSVCTRMKTLIQPNSSIVPVRDEGPLPSGAEMIQISIN